MCNLRRHMPTTRIQIVVDAEERERFRRQAEQEGLSLSAWLRRSAHARLAEQSRKELPRGVEGLRAFFARCDQRETGEEPNWDEHRRVIDASRRDGLTDP
jgi:hypothetical protein